MKTDIKGLRKIVLKAETQAEKAILEAIAIDCQSVTVKVSPAVSYLGLLYHLVLEFEEKDVSVSE